MDRKTDLDYTYLKSKRQSDNDLPHPEKKNFNDNSNNTNQQPSSNSVRANSHSSNFPSTNPSSNQSSNYRTSTAINLKTLPISQYREAIIDAMANNQIIIIAGETGCGKTTQVPQYIYHELNDKKEPVNILITQPRRIAAYSIAKRLAQEMDVNLGMEVGYHYGMTPVFSQEFTKILIMTTGIFLQRLIHEKNLDGYTHVILDEVHERDIDIDFVLVLMKNLLMSNSKIKLILMSATIATNLFANYFARSSIVSINKNIYEDEKKKLIESDANIGKPNSLNDNHYQKQVDNREVTWVWGENQDESRIDRTQTNAAELFTITTNSNTKNENENKLNFSDAAPIITIKEKIYPIMIFYIDTFIGNLSKDLGKSYSSFRTNFDKKNPKIDTHLYEIVLDLIKAIHTRKVVRDEPRNLHVLVFLPGFAEIENMYQMLHSNLGRDNLDNMDILKLHSNLTDEDQQRVFKESNRRKIILSTNIAESSITINDIYYVIDFCLVKELKFNVKTNHQSLDLNWASKASGNQRAGRAGRVGAGRVFRLVPSKFFESIQEDFSSPEILRVPLEKVILRVKVLDQGEPEEILGRALEPPNLKHIEAAIFNLQSMGALTLATEKSLTGELTELGVVYSEMPVDIKYSRLIMIGYAFDMLDPAIVTACLLTHEKNIFKKPQKENFYLSYGQANYFTDNTDSDMIKYYNAFKNWENLFGYSLHKDQYSRRIYNNRNECGNSEEEFCRKHMLDKRVLRDVLTLTADIKLRLKKLDLLNDNMTQMVDFKLEENQLMFKLILGGAFYGNYAKCSFYDIEKLKKIKNSKMNHDFKKSVTIKNVPMQVEDTELIRFAKASLVEKVDDIKVDEDNNNNNKKKDSFQNNNSSQNNLLNNTNDKFELKRCGEDVILVFNDDVYKESIKKMLNIGSNFRPRDTSFGLQVYDKSERENRFLQLKRPEYLFEIKSSDLFASVQVDIDYNSVNHVIIQEDESKVNNMFLVYENHHLKNGKYTARHSTLMPTYPMLDLILMLIFTPKATFYPSEENNRYASFRLVGTEIEFRFNYHFASCDVVEINYIRSALNEIIASKSLDYIDLKFKRETLKKSLIKLINKKRILIISNEEWWDLFFKFFPKEKLERISYFKMLPELMKLDNINYVNKGRNNSNNAPNKSKRTNDFLPPLNLLEIKEDYRLFTQEGITKLMNETLLFNDMREKILKSIAETKKNIYLSKTEIVCGLCNSYLCSAKNLKYENNVESLIKVSGWVSGFVNVFQTKDPEMPKDQEYVRNFEFESDKVQEWIACKTSNHILGIKIDNDFFVSEASNLRVHFPSDVYKKLDKNYLENNFALIFKEEKDMLTARIKILSQCMKCDLCDKSFQNQDDYLFHVEKDPSHKRRMTELLEENFTGDSKTDLM